MNGQMIRPRIAAANTMKPIARNQSSAYAHACRQLPNTISPVIGTTDNMMPMMMALRIGYGK